MIVIYVLVVLLTFALAKLDLAKNSFLEDASVFEYEDGEMSHRQVRHDKGGVVEPLSTRPYHDKLPYTFTYPSPEEKKSRYSYEFNDPYWQYQWYQQDYRTVAGPVMDHNIVPVQRMGFTGNNIKIGILGEQLSTHPEISHCVTKSFNAMVESSGPAEIEGPPPPPSVNMATQVAGVIGMKANNRQCGAGIAYNAEIVGIKVMEGDSYDFEDVVIGMNHQLINTHIYVDAIRKPHDGKELPFHKGVKYGLAAIANNGRLNNGGIYVLGAGDGRGSGDHCGADFVANSIYTFVIASAGKSGTITDYSERCSAIIATAYSSDCLPGSDWSKLPGVVSVDGEDSCTTRFGGTAASAAIAAGIFALTLQANPELTWRDLMHVITMTAEKAPLFKNDDWSRNDAGFWFNPNFGFGLLNAENMVITSQDWKQVPKIITCKLQFNKLTSLVGESYTNNFHTFELEVDSCPSVKDAEERLKYIEQVELVTSISISERRFLFVSLKSPKGTQSKLFLKRANDDSVQGLNKWRLRSLQFWGEQPFGKWVLTVEAEQPSFKDYGLFKFLAIKGSVALLNKGTFGYYGDRIRSAKLVIYGTSDMPEHYRKGSSNRRRTYSRSPSKRNFSGWFDNEDI